MMVTTMLIAVPTGIKVFSWLATMWEGKLHFAHADAVRARLPLDVRDRRPLRDLPRRRCRSTSTPPTRTSSSRTSTTCSSAARVFTIFAGIYYWFPKMTGRMYNERLGKLHFWLTFIGFNVTFFPMHWVGLQGMPRRVVRLRGASSATGTSSSRSFSFLLGASTIVFFYNMISSWTRGPIAPRQPVARDDARVAGQLAAAGLQLRRDPAGRRRAVRVRRSRRAARGAERRPRRPRCRGGGRQRDAARAAQAPRRRERDARRRRAARGRARARRGRRRARHGRSRP